MGVSRSRPNQGVTVNVALLVALPPGVVMRTFPVLAPERTRNVTRRSEFTVNAVTGTPPTVTASACMRPVPERVIESPTFPLGGLNPVIWGVTLKTLLDRSAPAVVVTLTNPVSPAGTVAVKKWFETTWKLAGVPLNSTLVAPESPSPRIPTGFPARPTGLVVEMKLARPVSKR